MDIVLNWSDFKNIINAKSINIQYYEIPTKEYYFTFAIDGAITYKCELEKGTENATDFETNYKSLANVEINTIRLNDERDPFGNLLVAPSLDYSMDLTPTKEKYKFTAVSGELTFFDIEVTTEKRLCGGEYWVSEDTVDNVHQDDFVEFSVIDKNDILGFFTPLGLTVGIHVLELNKFVRNDYVMCSPKKENYYTQCYEAIRGTSLVVAGLFLRIAYQSYGSANVQLIPRIFYYE